MSEGASHKSSVPGLKVTPNTATLRPLKLSKYLLAFLINFSF
jgi:hypothetical protein